MLKKGMITLVAVLLVLGGVLVPASPADAAKSTRVAEVLEVVGDAHITKSGGSKQFRLFRGMTLNQGDFLVTGPGAKVDLLLGDREDEVTVGENTSLYLSELSDTDAGKKSKFKLWTGSLWNKVKALAGAEDEFELETPTAVMGVRGTHFIVMIDPLTGLPKMYVASGMVSAGSPDDDDREAIVLPAQQITVYPDTDPSAGVDYVDPEQITVQADPRVIEMLLKNKAAIDEENDAMLDSLGESSDAGEGSTLSLTDEEILERFRQNVENMLFHLLKQASESGQLSEEVLNDIIETANQQIQDEARQYNLDREVPDIDRTAGVDPEEEELRRQQREAAEQRSRQQREERERRLQQVQEHNETLLDKIKQQRNEQQQANEEAEEQERSEAVDQLLNQLTEEERQELARRLEQRREEQQRQQAAAEQGQQAPQEEETPPESTTPGGGSGGSGGSDPGDSGSGTVTVDYEIDYVDEEYHSLAFRMYITVSNLNKNLYATEVHLTMQGVDFGVEQGGGSDQLFTWDNAVETTKNVDVLVDGEPGREFIYAAMLKPGQAAITVDEEALLVSIPIYVQEWDLNAITVIVDITLVDDQGEIIPINEVEPLTLVLPAGFVD